MYRKRAGVATYLQTFVLISVALGASLTVYSAVGTYVGGVPSPSLSLSGASIRQGSAVAVESVTISNTGTSTMPSATVTNPQLSPSLSYCYSLTDPVSNSLLLRTCPALSSNPTQILLAVTLKPGGSAVLELTVIGTAFAVGTLYSVTVQSSAGAQQTVELVAVPG